MAESKLKWCFGIKDGLKISEPNDELVSGLKESEINKYREKLKDL